MFDEEEEDQLPDYLEAAADADEDEDEAYARSRGYLQPDERADLELDPEESDDPESYK